MDTFLTGAFFCGHSERSALIQFGTFSSCLCTQAQSAGYFQLQVSVQPQFGVPRGQGRPRKTSPSGGLEMGLSF